MKSKLISLFIATILFSAGAVAHAGGFTAEFVPTRVDIVRGDGVMVLGASGNPGECTVANSLFIKLAHPQYKQIVSMILVAKHLNKKIQAYAHTCEPVAWFSVLSTTYNTVTPDGGVSSID